MTLAIHGTWCKPPPAKSENLPVTSSYPGIYSVVLCGPNVASVQGISHVSTVISSVVNPEQFIPDSDPAQTFYKFGVPVCSVCVPCVEGLWCVHRVMYCF